MKFFKLAIGVSLIALSLTGCNLSSKSPEELIKQKPVYNKEKEALYNGIKKLLPIYTSLILPENSEDASKINEIDLDGDGENELVVFQKKENVNDKKNEVGFIVLSKNGDDTYTDKGNLLQDGETIEYANFCDLNNDGNKEIVLLIKSEGKTGMYIYNFINNKIEKIYTLDPTWIKNSSEFTDMKIEIGYIDNDDKLDILMLNHNPKNNKLYVTLANFDDELNIANFVEFDNIKNLSNSYITIGTISTEKVNGKTIEKKGVILDMPTTQSDNYITQILYLKNKKLQKAFSDDYKAMIKPYYIPVEDVNNDKVIDIPIVKGSGDIYTTKTSANVSWYRWNGKEDINQSSVVFTIQIYYNYQYNFKLLIPNSLVNKFEMRRNYQGSDVLFECYYYDIGTKPKKLFTISVVSKNIMEDSKKPINQSAVILGENSNYTFTLYLNDMELLKSLKINEEALREYFSLIY